MRIRYSREDVLLISSMRESGMPMREIAKRMNAPASSIAFTLKKLQENPEWVPIKIPRTKINPVAFQSPLTDSDKYWIGFIMADGCVSGDTVIVNLSTTDKSHLEKLRQHTGIDKEIQTYENNRIGTWRSVFRFKSKGTVQNLARYGVIPRKTLTAECIGLETDRNFWRGVIDGDGHIRMDEERMKAGVSVILVGSENICCQFLDFCRSLTSTKVSISRKGNLHRVAFTAGPAIDIVSHLYKNSGVALDRKQAVANKIISRWTE